MSKITFHHQRDKMDCGPACLAMIANVYNKQYSVEYLRECSFLTKDGVSLLGITEASRKIGFDCVTLKLTTERIRENEKFFPCILHWNQNHFVVLYSVRKSKKFRIADPAHGFITLTEEKFKKSWLSDGEKGIALFLQPTEKFFKMSPPPENGISIRYLFSYLKNYRWRIFWMFLLLLTGSALTLIFPFLTQSLIDKGVNGKNLNFVTLILLAQLCLFAGSMAIEIIRNWIMLYVGTKLSIKIISDFLKKLLKLPIKFFDTKMQGDFQKRIEDNERIEHFLTSQSLLTFFSILTFSVFFGILWFYNIKILIIYLCLTVLAICWSLYWLKKRKILDYYKFQERAVNQDSIFEILNGVTEMKLNNFADYKRKEWEKIQERLFKLNIKGLKINQFQISGFEFINQLKNIVVTFIAATLVIKGDITIGIMMSITYIIGQMNSPVNQLVSFFRSLQDAKLSLERLNEVQNQREEENEGQIKLRTSDFSIKIENLSFQYEGPHSPFVLKNVNLVIPESKVTAIVGASGSGKTTLMKLLLKFYTHYNGDIFIGKDNIKDISAQDLRNNCGTVMQDGYIFADTIEKNIATADENINREKLDRASNIASLKDFIDFLPLKYNTIIGAAGSGISGGQKQRILIARAVYKNPQYIFFDEATSALDAENEKKIHDNLQEFFRGKTVIIIAHRLSTVKNADNIIVLDDGKVVEQGNHETLIQSKGKYYELVKNQLELGN